MNPLLQPFKFPKRLWLVISAALFLYLLFTVVIGAPGKFPQNFTAWRALVGGSLDHFVLGLFASFFWLVFALAFGAFLAAIMGVLRQLLRGSQ